MPLIVEDRISRNVLPTLLITSIPVIGQSAT